MISPTGKGMRRPDKWGGGNYRASRKKGMRLHQGVDYTCKPGQDVVSPITGVIMREARPYADPEWVYRYSGLVIYNDYCSLKLFYLEPIRHLIGTKVRMGDKVGIAQDISERYEGMAPHVHLEISSVDPEIFMNLL